LGNLITDDKNKFINSRAFVVSGALGRVEQIATLYAVGPVSSMSAQTDPNTVNPADKKSQIGAKLAEHIRVVNDSFPEEIVRYYSPGYADTLLEKIDAHNSGNTSQGPVKRNAAVEDRKKDDTINISKHEMSS
jgi:hypothetical protein